MPWSGQYQLPAGIWDFFFSQVYTKQMKLFNCFHQHKLSTSKCSSSQQQHHNALSFSLSYTRSGAWMLLVDWSIFKALLSLSRNENWSCLYLQKTLHNQAMTGIFILLLKHLLSSLHNFTQTTEFSINSPAGLTKDQ